MVILPQELYKIDSKTLAKIISWATEWALLEGRKKGNETKCITQSDLIKKIKKQLLNNKKDLNMSGIVLKGDGIVDGRNLRAILNKVLPNVKDLRAFLNSKGYRCYVHIDHYNSDKRIADYVSTRIIQEENGELIVRRAKSIFSGSGKNNQASAAYISESKQIVDAILAKYGMSLSKGNTLDEVLAMLKVAVVIEKNENND